MGRPSCRSGKAEVAGSEAEEVSAGTVPPDIWFLILLRNFDRNSMTLKTPAQDCSGRMIEPKEEEVDTCIYSADAKKLPDRPLTEDDLLIEALEDGRQLVWAKTSEYDNGEAVGPIAITEWTSRGVAVRAIGTLRAQKDRAAIRLEAVGADEMLVVESRRCDPDDPKNCSRRVRLVRSAATSSPTSACKPKTARASARQRSRTSKKRPSPSTTASSEPSKSPGRSTSTKAPS